MKEVKKEIKKEITDIEVKYIAVDGTEFTSQAECEEYEKIAKCALLVRYNALKVRETTEYDLFHAGSEDSAVDIVQLKEEKDKDTIIQLLCLYQSQLEKPEYKGWLDRAVKKVHSALQSDGFLFIGRGCCEDDFWIMESATSVLECIKAACKPKEEENKDA